jgi:hypothetical protein
MKTSSRFLLGRTRLLLLFAGLVFVLILMWIGVEYGSNLHLEDILRIRAKKMEILSRMRADLLKSVEAEKNAVMADTDESSRSFADESRQAAEAIDRDRRELGLLIEEDHSDQETRLLREFDRSWADLREIDQLILDLAVKNTNIKAAKLSFTKGSLLLKRFEEALRDINRTEVSVRGPSQISEHTCSALTAALKILCLHAPHIAETQDDQMDKFEAEMDQYAGVIKTSLLNLKVLIPEEKLAYLQEAEMAYDEFSRVTAEVVDLSRQNTNIKSFELSLGRKRKATAQCDEILVSLLKVVQSKEFKATR